MCIFKCVRSKTNELIDFGVKWVAQWIECLIWGEEDMSSSSVSETNSCATFGKSLNPSLPQFPDMQTEDHNTIFPAGLYVNIYTNLNE